MEDDKLEKIKVKRIKISSYLIFFIVIVIFIPFIFVSFQILVTLITGKSFFGPGAADYCYNISGDYKLYHAGDSDIVQDDNTIIYGDIIKIAWDEDFICAIQEVDDTLNYWIIDVTTDKIYGPLTEDYFESKRNELGVNTNLKLKSPERFRYLEKLEVDKK